MRHFIAALALSCAAILAASAADAPIAGIKLGGPENKDMGSATLKEGPTGLVLRVDATGLAPGWHGMHFHMVGDCSDNSAGFKKSGDHVGHGAAKHGLLNAEGGPEMGDLPNLYAGADGAAHAEFFVQGMKLETLNDADGTALVIHAKEDDHMSQPIGGAGDRVACGVVGKPS